jgi:hypothetical protein
MGGAIPSHLQYVLMADTHNPQNTGFILVDRWLTDTINATPQQQLLTNNKTITVGQSP